MKRWLIPVIACILIFSSITIYSQSAENKSGVNSFLYNDMENASKSIVYILPHEICNDYWTKKYGDRIYYYVYENISRNEETIRNDFGIISSIYDTVIIVIPADDTQLYFHNIRVIDKIAGEYDMSVIYAIFPGEKYGDEDTYIEEGSKMHSLIIQDMQYMSSLNHTYKVAIWYGWTYRCDSADIVSFYDSLPGNLKEKYAVWLDEEYAERVRDVYANGMPHNVLFITEAYDKMKIEEYSCLYYNQMLITGYEGASSLQEWRKNVESLLSACKCKNVGIWIFYDIGDGAGEEYAALMEGKLSDFNFSYEIPFQKGFSYAAWWNDTLLSPDSDASIKNLHKTGTEFVSIVPTWYQNDEHSTQIMPDTYSTPSDESIIHAIDVVHSLGMKIMLKPHVDLYNEKWRGEICFNSNEKWRQWFKSYENFILHYAHIASEHGVEQFCVGCELVKTVERQEWFDVIKKIRRNFSGLITYAADWSNYRNVSFWNAVDFIGVDAYFELTDKNDPSLNELLQAWKRWKSNVEKMHNDTGKPIVFTEIGYRSIDGCNRDPWNWQRHGKIDLKEQADCYEAAFRTFWHEPWFYGFYWWMWYPNTSIGGENDDSYTPYKKPAESMLKEYYLGINLSVEIERPRIGYLYIFDREILHIGKTIVIGKIAIKAIAKNATEVEFYVDDELKFVSNTPPYQWLWNEFAIGEHEIKVAAYDELENKFMDEERVWIYNI